jgi:hypothetical protein
MVLIEVIFTKISEGSFDWKLKVLVHFFRVNRDWRAISPPPPSHPFLQLDQIKLSSYGRGTCRNFIEFI